MPTDDAPTTGDEHVQSGPDAATRETERDSLLLAEERAATAAVTPGDPASPAELRKKLEFLRLRPWQTPH